MCFAAIRHSDFQQYTFTGTKTAKYSSLSSSPFKTYKSLKRRNYSPGYIKWLGSVKGPNTHYCPFLNAQLLAFGGQKETSFPDIIHLSHFLSSQTMTRGPSPLSPNPKWLLCLHVAVRAGEMYLAHHNEAVQKNKKNPHLNTPIIPAALSTKEFNSWWISVLLGLFLGATQQIVLCSFLYLFMVMTCSWMVCRSNSHAGTMGQYIIIMYQVP